MATRRRISNSKHEFIFLCKCNNSQRKKITQIISDKVIRAVSDVCATLLYGNLGKRVSNEDRLKLRRHKKTLLKLSNPKLPIKKKRKIIQGGGGLLTSIGGFLEKLFNI